MSLQATGSDYILPQKLSSHKKLSCIIADKVQYKKADAQASDSVGARVQMPIQHNGATIDVQMLLQHGETSEPSECRSGVGGAPVGGPDPEPAAIGPDFGPAARCPVSSASPDDGNAGRGPSFRAPPNCPGGGAAARSPAPDD